MLEEIIAKLEAYKNTNKKVELSSYIAYFQDFFRKYPPLNIMNYQNITFKDLITAGILLKNSGNFEAKYNLLEKYSSLLLEKKNADLIIALTIFFDWAKFYNMEFSEQLKLLQNFKKGKIPYRLDVSYYFNTLDEIGINKKCFKKSNLIIDSLVIKEIKYLLEEVPLEYMGLIKGALGDIDDIKFLALVEKKSDLQRNFKRINKKGDESCINQVMNYLYNTSLNEIQSLKDNEKNSKKENQKLKDLIKLLKTKEEIKDIEAILKLCPDDEELKSQILDYIIAHNEKIYHKLYLKFESLTTVNAQNITKLLANFGYNYEDLTEVNKEEITKLGLTTTKEILLNLYNLKIIIDINVLPLINLSKLKIINDLITKGTLSKEFVVTNFHLTYDDNSLLDDVINRIYLLSSKSINIQNYQNSLTILLSNNLLINLDLLAKYKLNITKNTSNINFLKDNNLEAKINLLIELDLFDNIDNLEILNNDLDTIYLIKLAQLLNIDLKYLTKDLIFKPSYELIPKDILNLFEKEITEETELPEILEAYKVNEYELNIKGVKVSLNRFLTNLSKLNDNSNLNIFYALIYHSYYELDAINTLKEVLDLKELTLVRR